MKNLSRTLLLCGCALAIFAVVQTTQTFAPREAMAEAQQPQSNMQITQISVETPKGLAQWTVKVAENSKQRQIGLMFVKSMPKNEGMLFDFGETEPIAMWMKNTFIPLDMVFMNENGRITHIHKGAVPHSLDVISSKGPVRYVLELNAGEVARTGLAVDQIMKTNVFQRTENQRN